MQYKKTRRFLEQLMKINKILTAKLRSIPIEKVCKDLQLDININRQIKCPFNSDLKEHLLYVFTHRNSFMCFECEEEGDVIRLVMKTLNLEQKRAMKWLYDRFIEKGNDK